MPRYSDVESYTDFQQTLNKPTKEPWVTLAKALYYTGTRERELTSITSEEVSWDEQNTDFLNVKIHTLKNKRTKIRIVPINKILEPQAIKVFTDAQAGKLPQEPLFYDRSKNLETFLRALRRNINKLYGGVAPHYFRHVRLTHCITKFGFNDYDLKQYAGWTDVRPGSFYIHLRVQDLQSKMGAKK